MIDKIQTFFNEIFKTLNYKQDFAVVTISDRPELSDFQCNGALKLAKELGKNPREIGDSIKEILEKNYSSYFEKISVDGPGFINLKISNEFLIESFNKILNDEKMGFKKEANPKKVVLDYGGPNVAKELHVGHLRPAVIGESVKRIIQFCGDETIADVHLGDFGLPMGMLIEAIKKQNPDLPYFDENFKGEYPKEPPITVSELNDLYPKASSLCKEDETEKEKARLATKKLQEGDPGYNALWKHFVDLSVIAIRKVYDRLGVSFDLWNGEAKTYSTLMKIIEEQYKKGVIKDSEGAKIIEVKEESDNKEVPPLIIEKSNGAVMYGGTDLATIVERKRDFDPDKVLYFVGNRQALHFEQVFRASEKIRAIKKENLEHIGNGTVNGPDGKPFKTRSGGVMKLNEFLDIAKDKVLRKMNESANNKGFNDNEIDEIAEQVGVSAVIFADLQNYRGSDYIFNIDNSVKFEGKTGPYILYTAVRLKSLLSKLGSDFDGEIKNMENDEDRVLVLSILNFSTFLKAAYEKRAPNILADYLYSLTQNVNNFYHKYHILSEEDSVVKSDRVLVLKAALSLIEMCGSLLLLRFPEKM